MPSVLRAIWHFPFFLRFWLLGVLWGDTVFARIVRWVAFLIALGVGIGFLREPVWVGLVTARTQFVHFERPLGIVLLGLGGFLFIVFQAGVAWRRALRETPGFDLVVDEDCSEDGPRNALETGLLPGCPHWSVFSVTV